MEGSVGAENLQRSDRSSASMMRRGDVENCFRRPVLFSRVSHHLDHVLTVFKHNHHRQLVLPVSLQRSQET
jgi:hypothetical protein